MFTVADTLKEILRELDNKLTEEDILAIIEEVDEDGSGTLDFDGEDDDVDDDDDDDDDDDEDDDDESKRAIDCYVKPVQQGAGQDGDEPMDDIPLHSPRLAVHQALPDSRLVPPEVRLHPRPH